MSMLTLLMAVLAQATTAPDAPTPDQVRSWTATEAVQQLLPPETAALVVDGTFRAGGPPGYYAGYWWSAGEPAGEGLCRRTAYRVTVVGGPNTPMETRRLTFTQFAPTYPDTANPPSCGSAKGWFNTTPEDEAVKLGALARLVDAIRLASADGDLPFEVSCESTSPRSCGEARAALRDLPLQSLYDVRPKTDQYRDDPVVNGVRTRYALPPSGGVYPAVEMAFGPEASADTWYVTLHGRERVERVEIRRAMVIYH